MTLLIGILLAAQPAAVAACDLRTPGNRAVMFEVSAFDGREELAPISGSAWPASTVSALAATRDSGGQVIGDAREGHSLRRSSIGSDKELATLFKLRRGKPELPVAVGFCRPGKALDGVKEQGASGPGDISPESWGGVPCTLVTPDGRSATMDYLVRDGRGSSFTSVGGWPWAKKTSVPGGQINPGSGVGRFGGKKTSSGTVRFFVAEKQAAHLLLFDKLDPEQPGVAAAICGYNNISRRPNVR